MNSHICVFAHFYGIRRSIIKKANSQKQCIMYMYVLNLKEHTKYKTSFSL